MTTRLYGINCTLRVSPGLLIGFSSFSLQQTTKDVSKLLSFSPPAKSQPSLLSLFFFCYLFYFFPPFFLNLKRHSTYWFLLGSCSLVQSLSIFLKTLLCDMYIFLFFFRLLNVVIYTRLLNDVDNFG
jgi:hypothetical protein